MKIFFSQPNFSYYSTPKNEVKQNQSTTSTVSFSADYTLGRDLVTRINPNINNEISSDAEYKDTLNRIYNYKTQIGAPLFYIEYNRENYPNIKNEQEGLLLYAGFCDLSDDINRFLSNREMRNMNKEQAIDVIRAFDYSLKKLDENYGTYSGITYRQGIFPLGQNQYISTTIDPVIAATLRGGIELNKNLEFSIVKMKNGHRINRFQHEMGTHFAESEEEILSSRESMFREITEPKGEMLTLKEEFHKILEKHARQKVNPDKIKIYEEI